MLTFDKLDACLKSYGDPPDIKKQDDILWLLIQKQLEKAQKVRTKVYTLDK